MERVSRQIMRAPVRSAKYMAAQIQQITKRLHVNIAIALLFALGFPDATAQRAVDDPLQIKLVRSKVVLERGREVKESATLAKPGDILEEVATYTNRSKAALKNLEATLPIPFNTELVMASVKPGNAKASVDGKEFSALPLVSRVRQPNGVDAEVAVPLSEYRYLRWYPGELLPGKPLSVSARFRVSNSPLGTINAGN